MLGDMLELGARGAGEHRKIGRTIARDELADIVLTTGTLAKNIAESAGGRWFCGKEDLLRHLKRRLKPGDAVLFKASRCVGLDDIAGKVTSERKK